MYLATANMEPLGDEVVAAVISGGEELKITLPPETSAQLDEPINLVVDLGKLHLLDPQTEEANLLRATEAGLERREGNGKGAQGGRCDDQRCGDRVS